MLLIDWLSQEIIFKRRDYEKACKENNSLPLVSVVYTFLKDHLVKSLTDLRNDEKVSEIYSADNLQEFSEFIDSLNNFIKKLETEKDKQIDLKSLDEILKYLTTALSRLSGLRDHFNSTTV